MRDDTAAAPPGGRPRQRLNLRRELSDQAVLEVIFREGPITRPEIAARTGLSKPTVSEAVRRLESARLVRSAGQRTGRLGRTPVSYAVDDGAGFVVGLDIGGVNLRVAAANLYGELTAEERRSTTKRGPRALARQVLDMLHGVVAGAGAGAGGGRLLALGISTPGVISPVGRLVSSLAYNVTPSGELDPLAMIGDSFDAPVLVDNNVNLAAVGEKWRGLAKGVQNFVFISVGAGVGMGVVVDDQLVRGAHGAAGEICYLPLTSDPFDRRHRRHGGFEDEVAAAAILDAARRRAGWDGAPPGTVEEVFRLARRNHPAAKAIVEDEGRRLGVAIAAVCAVIDPELVVLGGGIGGNPALLRPVRRTVAALAPFAPRIEATMLGERASLYGALAIALREAHERLFAAATGAKRTP